MKRLGLLGLETEILLLNKNLEPVDATKRIIRKLPKFQRGVRGSELGMTRVVKELYGSMLEINFRPFWDDEFDHFVSEIQNTLISIWKVASEDGIYPCLLGLPPSVPPERGIRPGETCAIHFHYSWGGGFLRQVERVPYYNGFVMTYLIMLPATASSGFLAGKERAFIDDRYKLATALYPPVYLTEESFDFDYILEEMEKMSAELGTHHAYPQNPRLLDIAPLTKEEAYFMLSRKSTVEIRAFDTPPSLLLIRALWILIAAYGRFITENLDQFRHVDRAVYRAVWTLRSRVIKHGFKATTVTVSRSLLPQIGGEPWPRFLYEKMTVRDALLWFIDSMGEYIDVLSETSKNIKPTINTFINFVKEGLTPAEKLMRIFKAPDWKKKLLEICEWAIYNADYVP